MRQRFGHAVHLGGDLMGNLRQNMTDKQCKVVLTDFGTACTANTTDRLSSGVGTKIFWSPEFFDRDYGQKVDVWAMGVIMYGLASGRFPFRDENDVRNKEVRIPKREFIRKMLEKNEKLRMSSSEAKGNKIFLWGPMD
eukprot:s20_g22.t1